MSGPTQLTMVRGDTRFFTCTVTKNTLPVDLTGSTLTFNAQAQIPEPAAFSRSTTDGSVTFTSPTLGLAQLRIDPIVTSVFDNRKLLFLFQWVLIDTSAEVSTIEWGELIMFPNVVG
jgi:hypothetical protein